MTVDEEAVVFDCEGDSLVGIIASGTPGFDTGVVFVVGGPQYRAGSHRHFVDLARAFADAGFPTLRFDYRGMGDSGGAQRRFEQVDDDLRAAIDELLRRRPRLRRVVLWGLCDGASASLLYLHATGDPRVAGLCLLNPWVRSEASLARTHVKHYYLQRLLQPGFWRKLFGGQVALAAVRGLLDNLRLARRGGGSTGASFQQRMAAALGAFGGPVLLFLSENDYTAKEFIEYANATADWREALARANIHRTTAAGADHTLSEPAAKAFAEERMLQWLREHWPSPLPDPRR